MKSPLINVRQLLYQNYIDKMEHVDNRVIAMNDNTIFTIGIHPPSIRVCKNLESIY